jgi:hypothetical protein
VVGALDMPVTVAPLLTSTGEAALRKAMLSA